MIGLTLIYYLSLLLSARSFSLFLFLSRSSSRTRCTHAFVLPLVSHPPFIHAILFSLGIISRIRLSLFRFTLKRSRCTFENLRDEACFEGHLVSQVFFSINLFRLILNRCSLIRALDKRFPLPLSSPSIIPHPLSDRLCFKSIVRCV